MKNPLGGGNGMVPHYSGTTLDAQARYASGTKSILENYLTNKSQEPQNVIVGLGKFESKACKYILLPEGAYLTIPCRRPKQVEILAKCIQFQGHV